MIDELHKIFNKLKRYRFPFNGMKSEIPMNGVYLIFENGERYKEFDRIVRIGTHTGKDQLYARLTQHFENENKNRSIFRKNIGRCILNRERSDYLKIWELDTTSRKDKAQYENLVDIDFERIIEKRISEYIQSNLSFCVFESFDKEERLHWERRFISTLASSSINPSTNWLGNYSTKDKIRSSGLWQVNELNGQCMAIAEIDELKKTLVANNR
jgi:hypothetical protein